MQARFRIAESTRWRTRQLFVPTVFL